MDGATLRLLDRIRLSGADAIEAFVLLVVGRTSVGASDAWWVGSIVDEAMQEPATDRAAPFRVAYDAAAELPISMPPARKTGSLALEGLLSLPVPQRVTLALSCILGFTPGEVASVVGFAPQDVKTLLEDGIATIRAAARGANGASRWSAVS